ncbi:MAG TPA: HlyD family secretion protein [Stellaceae bacterium]|jgi:membrane fusion protein, multidrug efflux system|nr:HlyD family secretion protein [Stellaceae bacterium]
MEKTLQREEEVSMSAELKLASPSAATAEVPGARRDATAFQPGPRPHAAAHTPQKASRFSRRRLLRWALFALLPLALFAGADWYVTGGQVVSTDDAYVQADTVGISTDISGTVQSVEVTDNQQVSAGQILYRLDPKQFQIALDNAKASLTQVALNIQSMRQDYQRMLSDVDSQQAKVDLDQATYNRYAALVRSDAVSRENYDQARFTLDADKSKLKSLQQQAQVQLARLDGNPDIPVEQHPAYIQAQSQVDEAQRQLDHTVVKAPFAGIVTNVPSIAPGKYLAASATAFYLVDTDHLWVEATPKETELTYVRPGQPSTVTVDTYPGVQWHGIVESISPAAAQQFALLPAQNTSGNWVKVVQRIDMRVRIDASDKKLPPLRAGMSAEVSVDTAHTRGLPHFLTTLFGGADKAA